MARVQDVESWLDHPQSATPDKVLEFLDRLEGCLPGKSLVEWPAIPHGTALVAGDTHGDVPLVRRLVREHLERVDGVDLFLTLGDYVDRTPRHVPYGSLLNALYILSLSARYPEKFLALRGNHETLRHVPTAPSQLDSEARQLFGDDTVAPKIWDRIEELPLAATTENGAYLAHAGFPMVRDWKRDLAHPCERTYFQVVWNDVDVSPVCGKRGIDQTPIGEQTLSAFLQTSGSGIVVRGHDPYVGGIPLYQDRLMTVHTTHSLVGNGIFTLEMPLDGRLTSLKGTSLRRHSP